MTTSTPNKSSAEAKENITGLILCGGKGSRMGGQDKGLVLCQGKRLVEHALEAMQPYCSQIIINANRNIKTYCHYEVEVVPDLRPDYQGPLAGIEAGLIAAKTPFVLVFSVDSLPPPPATIEQLLSITHVDIGYLCDDNGPQYLTSMISTTTLPSLSERLDLGQRAVKHWYASLNTATTRFTGSLFNLNTTEQLQAYQKINKPTYTTK